jgi:hypothetical protein
MAAGIWAEGSKGDGRFTLAAGAGYRAQNASSLKKQPKPLGADKFFRTGQGRSIGGTGNS